jgi:hypothetical protein
MPIDVAEMIYTLLMILLIGTFILAFPITKRLGRVMEEWIQLRRESLPDRDSLAATESRLQAVEQQLDSLGQSVALIADRLEFTESLMESGQRRSIARQAESIEG